MLDTDGDGWISKKEAAAHPEVAANFRAPTLTATAG